MSNVKVTPEEMKKRVIRVEDFVADKAAFIDAKTPGSDKKENYCIIGPGVSENENKFVNLKEPHGFNIGAAAMPNGCTNSLHLHLTAEVFIVAKGTWKYRWGNEGTDGEAILTEGDVISLPTHIFRGFTNVGSDEGFLFSILGENDPGKVIWGPQVLRDAKGHGLVLLEDGRLIDTNIGMKIPEGVRLIEPLPEEKLAKIKKVSLEEMSQRIFRFKDRTPHMESYLDSRLPGCKKKSYGIIGPGIASAGDRPSIVNNKHTFGLELIEAEPGNGFALHKQPTPMVLVVKQGQWKVSWGEGGKDGEVVLKERDVMSIPCDIYRSIVNVSDTEGLLYMVSGGDERVKMEWAPEVVEAALQTGLVLDENGILKSV